MYEVGGYLECLNLAGCGSLCVVGACLGVTPLFSFAFEWLPPINHNIFYILRHIVYIYI